MNINIIIECNGYHLHYHQLVVILCVKNNNHQLQIDHQHITSDEIDHQHITSIMKLITNATTVIHTKLTTKLPLNNGIDAINV